MVVIGIDLSLRSTGICYNDNNETFKFALVCPDAKKYNDEPLVAYMTQEIINFIEDCPRIPDAIHLEGLSFGSISGSKDILAGNFWHLRVALWNAYMAADIIPVTSWRSPLFNKEERKLLKENVAAVKKIKEQAKGKSLAERKEIAAANALTILGADVKYCTYMKLPEDVKQIIECVTIDKSRFDLCDAYFLSCHKNK